MNNNKLIDEILRLSELRDGKSLAKALDIHPSIITRIRQGKRPFTVFQAKTIELLTHGKVHRTAIRPDVFL